MQIHSIEVPIAADEDGVLRVGGTRVTLDVIVSAFEHGATPEEIAQDFSSLQLADVYAVLSYYLQHSERIAGYLSERRDEAEMLRRHIESRSEVAGLRQRLRSECDRATPL